MKDPTPSNFQVWYTHLKTWMLRAIQIVFDEDAINKYVLLLCSFQESIGKSYFCEFLSPPSLLDYYTNRMILNNEKDTQQEVHYPNQYISPNA